MRVVIAGAGLVGRGLAQRLAAGRHDVTVVELDREVCERVYSQIGVATIHGSATSISVLEEAEVGRADCAAGVMRSDADNLTFSLLAKSMGVPRIIVRMRDPRYQDAYRQAGATSVLNIVGLYLNQFTWEIEDPSMREVTSLGQGRASIVFVKVSEKSPGDGRTVAEIAKDAEFPTDCVIAGIFRPATGAFIVPRGHVAVAAGDRVYLAAHSDAIRQAVRYLGRK
jgi:trk system potassium uptake protein TrkA